MDLLTYIADMPRRLALAEACGTSPDYLWQLATKWRGRKPSAALAAQIERESERLGPERVPKEPLIFGEAVQRPATEINSGITKRALMRRLALVNETGLAVVLGLPREEVEALGDDDQVPALPQVLVLLQQPEAAELPVEPADPDDSRIVPVEVA